MATKLEIFNALRKKGAFNEKQEEIIKALEGRGELENNLDFLMSDIMGEEKPKEEEKPPVVEQPPVVEKPTIPENIPQGAKETIARMPVPENRVSDAPKGIKGVGEFALGLGETALSGLTAGAAVPLSGIAGMSALIAGPEEAERVIKETQEGLTYKPRTKSAETTQAGLGQIAQEMVTPYEEKIVGPAAEYAGEKFGPTAAGLVGAAGTALPIAAAEVFGPRFGAKTLSHRGKKFSNAAEVERTQFLESKGLTPDRKAAPTRAQITQEATDIAQEDYLSGIKGGNVSAHLARQNKILEENMRNAVKGKGHNIKEGDLPLPSGETNQIIDITNNYVKTGEQLIDVAYKEAKAASGGRPVVKPTNFIAKLRELNPMDKSVNHVVSAMRNFAKDLKVFDRVGPGKTKLSTVDTMEDLVKRANGLHGTDPNVNRVLRQLKAAIDKDVAASGGTTKFKEARDFTNNFFKSMDRSTTTRMAKKKNSIVQDILDDRTIGDNLVENVLTKKKYDARDISDLREFTLSQPNGKQAWQNFRAETIDYILDNSIVEKNGVQVISRKKFEASLRKFGKDEKRLRQVFSADEYKELVDFSRALKLVDRPATAGQKASGLEALRRWWGIKAGRLKEFAVLQQLGDFVFNPQKQALTLPMGYTPQRLAGGVVGEKAFEKDNTNE